MTKEEAKLLLIRPTVSSNVISETKAREIEAYNMAIEALSERTGEWIYSTKQLEIVPMWECSCCRMRMPKKFNYCPNCGAKMCKGGDEE